MSKKVDKFTFGIQFSELGKYKADGITLDNLPEGYIDKFNEATIIRAKELKAKHEDKYSDEYYLEMARKLQIRDMYGAFREIGQKSCLKCEIKDPQWAEYTYEEIIQMENDGYKVPKEILEWAHAQQQADEVNYVILTEEADFDTTTVPDVSDPNDLNGLKARSMQDIAKVEKAEKETEKTANEYNLKSASTKQRQANKENSYKDSMDKIVSLTNEWKTLNDKQKNGTPLTKEEQKRFEELGKLLNSSNGKLIKEIQIDNLELKSYLNSLDTLSEKIQYNTEIANQTIKNAIELSGYMERVGKDLPFVKAKLQENKGLTNETLNGIRDEELSTVAMDKGKDLEQINFNLSQDLFEDDSANLRNFATDYTNTSSKTEEYAKSVMGEAFDKPVEGNKENKENQNNQDNTVKSENTVISLTDVQKSTKESKENILDVILNQNKTDTENIKQGNNNKKSLKDIIKLNKEIKISEDQPKEILSEEEAFLAKLEESSQNLRTKSSAEERVENRIANNNEGTKSELSKTTQEKNTTPDNSDNSKNTEYLIKSQNTNIADQNIKTGIEKTPETSITSTDNTEQTSKVLTTQNNNLNQINNNSANIAEQTLSLGTSTYAKSFITNAIDNYLQTTGIGPMANFATSQIGVTKYVLGNQLLNLGYKENNNDTTTAGNVPEIGIAASANANESDSNTKEQIKESDRIKKTLQESGKPLEPEQQPELKEINNQNRQDTQEELPNEALHNNTAQNTDIETNADMQSIAANQNSEVEAVETVETSPSKNNQDASIQKETQALNNNENTELVQQPDKNNNSENNINETAEDNTNENKETAEQKNSTNDAENNSLSIQFSMQNSIKATEMTLASTNDISNEQTKIEKNKNQIEKETQKSDKLVKDSAKQTSQIVEKHNANQAESDILSQQLVTAQNKINAASNVEEVQDAKNEGETLNEQITKIQDQDSQISQTTGQEIKKNIQQIAKLQKNAADFGKDINNLNSNNAKHLELSEKSIIVGVGTRALGALDINIGTTMITSGTAMMANPLTEPEGAALITAGKILSSKGVSEQVTGGLALASGITGSTKNTTAQNASIASTAVENNANLQYKTSDKILNDSTKSLSALGIEIENTELQDNSEKEDIDSKTNKNKEAEKEKLEQEYFNLGLNESVIAASATSNTDIIETIETDEKNERKLSRFNEESIIESRKKKKKVIEVSASSRNRR